MTRLALLLSCCLLAGCSAISSPGDDKAAWQGTWKMVSTTYDGKPQPGDMEWVVDGDHYNIRVDGKLGPDPYQITLDPARRRVDIFHHDTPAGTYGGKLKGIYEVGGDTLAVCYDLTGQSYPDAMDAGPGSRRVVYRFQKK